MGVGKTANCRELNNNLDQSAWLDGDWCWMINPFIVNEENKRMVINNITYLLRSYLTNSSLQYVIFSWVIHLEEIYNDLLSPLDDLDFEVVKITLTCSEEALRERILSDVIHNLRDESSLENSIERLPMYKNMSTTKIDTTNLSIIETAEKIKNIVCS